MRDDEIKDVVINDSTLMEFASRVHEENGHLKHRHQNIAQRNRKNGQDVDRNEGEMSLTPLRSV